MSEKLGVGIVGLGFMGQTHLGAYQRADEAGFGNKLVAVCDADPERRAGKAPARAVRSSPSPARAAFLVTACTEWCWQPYRTKAEGLCMPWHNVHPYR